MRDTLLCMILALAAARDGSPPGRRLLQRRLEAQAPFNTARKMAMASPTAEQRRRHEASERVAKELAEQQSPDAAFQTAANRTTALLRKRAALLAEVQRIDSELAKERDSRRAAITRKYEEELKALDEEESRYVRPPMPAGGESLRDQIAAAVVAHQTSGRNRGSTGGGSGMAHQDIEHQDVDIDVILTHIDADGDGVITKAEAKSASTGAAVVQFGPSALVGCLAGVVCYVLCRFAAARYLRHAPPSSRAQGGMAAWLHPRGAGKTPLAVVGTASKLKGSASSEVVGSHDKAARIRKRHAESQCDPAIAC
jgi:hypothetical protein